MTGKPPFQGFRLCSSGFAHLPAICKAAVMTYSYVLACWPHMHVQHAGVVPAVQWMANAVRQAAPQDVLSLAVLVYSCMAKCCV